MDSSGTLPNYVFVKAAMLVLAFPIRTVVFVEVWKSSKNLDQSNFKDILVNMQINTAKRCWINGCDLPVRAGQKPEHIMCLAHWRAVPNKLRDQIMGAWLPSQAKTGIPSRAWEIYVNQACKLLEGAQERQE